MPQTRRVLSTRQTTSNQKNVSIGAKASSSSKAASTSLVSKKRASNDDSKRDLKRAALSEITNAVASEKPSLKSQVKKGLSNIVALGKGAANNAKPTRKFRLANGSKSNESSLKTDADITDEFEVSESQSLPSSQESIAGKTTISDITIDEEDESEYESAEENDENLAPTTCQRYVPPPRPIPPTGVDDFDLENWNDHLQCSEYVFEIFTYYKSREAMFRIPDYMADQPEINKSMRAILVDWLVEVQESFELNHETLYTAVKMMDLFLSRRKVKREDLQLIGATACLISCKIDERIPPLLEDFVYVCDGAYSRREIIAMEREMISTVDYDTGYPLTYRFLRRYGRVCKVTMQVLTFARYILETSLLEYKLNVEVSESRLAAATLVTAMKIRGVTGWVETLKFYSGYSPLDLADLVNSLLAMLKLPHKETLKTIRQKYSHKVFHEVALFEIPNSIEITESG